MPEISDEMKREGEEPATPAGKARLAEEARALRKKVREARRSPRRRPLSGFWKVIYLLVIASVLGVAFLLLNRGDARQALAEQIAAAWFGVYPSQERVFELPPPPPRSVEPQVRVGGPQGQVTFGEEGFEGVLYRDDDGITTSSGEQESEEGAADFVPPTITPESEAALNLLRASSEPMGDLMEGELEGYEYQEWTPLQNDPPRYIVDLVAVRSDSGEEVHLVWEVNLETETVRPLSQAARDLAQ